MAMTFSSVGSLSFTILSLFKKTLQAGAHLFLVNIGVMTNAAFFKNSLALGGVAFGFAEARARL